VIRMAAAANIPVSETKSADLIFALLFREEVE